MLTPKITTIDAKKLFEYFAKKPNEKDKPYCIELMNKYFYQKIIDHTADFDECPLFHQIIFSDTFKKNLKKKNIDVENDMWLREILLIVDFGDIFLPSKSKKLHRIAQKIDLRSKAKSLIEEGLVLKYFDCTGVIRIVHMVPFDKSGNMSRKSCITFINEDYYKEMNQRLNLGIDFSNMNVILSKYYAYRGLYLSSSKRVEFNVIEITPETLIIMKDNRKKKNGSDRPTLGPSYERNVPVITAEPIEDNESCTQKWNIKEIGNQELLHVETPFDGEGFISFEYAEKINKSLQLKNASSYQIRLPFSKGMLHKVDVHAFLAEFDPQWKKSDTYMYEDAFGISRDLKKAHIFLSESMFKGMHWLIDYCKKDDIKDPMAYYCEKLKDFKHALYISGTNIPYGHTSYTHLSYQMINTLDFSDVEFANVAQIHSGFIQNPSDYIKKSGEFDTDDEVGDEADAENKEESADEIMDEDTIVNCIPAWKEALLEEPSFEDDIYIRRELENTQKSLLTKLIKGKLLVKGQMRYLCRDLLPFLVNLIKDEEIINKFYFDFLWMRFYLPLEDEDKFKDEPGLKYSGFSAFFRSPHLSRNEQCLLQPFVLCEDNEKYIEVNKKPYEDYVRRVELYKKYFGHLTGIVMVPRGSIVPLSLGGADFDGDLVNIVFDQNVVAAVRRGCYEGEWLKRKLPVIEIPSIKATIENVPKYVPYKHIRDTFSNQIGYLSNTAIAIGQIEYDKKSEKTEKVKDVSKTTEPSGITCAMCTILTGLEIDAAKNGKHPDLSIIEECEIPPSSYLSFYKMFKKYKANPDFNYDDLVIEKKDSGEDKQKECIRFYVENIKSKEKPEFTHCKDGQQGTKINKLPILFCEAHSAYKKSPVKKKCKRFEPFSIDSSKRIEKSEEVKTFENKCQSVIKLYLFYRILLGNLKKEKMKYGFGAENLSKLILKKYDKSNASYIQENVVPTLEYKIDKSISDKDQEYDIRKRINEYQWQFQPDENKGEILEKIIGNDFSEEDLTEEEKELLYHFNQQGYKVLWHLISSIIDARCESYDNVKAQNKKPEFLIEWEALKRIDDEFDQVERAYYEENYVGIDNKLFRICTNEIKDICSNTELDLSYKVHSLYEITKGNVEYRRIFWDVFSWEDLKKCCKIQQDKKE